MTATLTACDRPEYLAKVIRCLERNATGGLHLFCGVEPLRDEVAALCRSIDFMPTTVMVNSSRLGVRDNPYRLLSHVFEVVGATHNVYMEDDVPLAPDALDLARWYVSLPDFEDYACGLLFNYQSDRSRPSSVEIVPEFNSLGFVLSRSQWQRFFKPYWMLDDRGWDWSIIANVTDAGRGRCLRPALSRAENIGEVGTHTRPQDHRRRFGGLAISDGSVRRYRMEAPADGRKEPMALAEAVGGGRRLSLEAFAAHVVAHAEPLSQNAAPGDLGFGWLYYAFVRNVRPEYVVAIGSRRGFMPFCAARAVRDNGRGKVLFVDPSYSGYGHPGWSGGGFWSDPDEVAARIEAHGLTGWIEHVKLESADAYPSLRARIGAGGAGVVIVDGAHTYENSLQDFELYSSLFSEGFVLFHDATSPETGVPRAIAELRARGVPLVTVHREVGLAIAEIPPRRAVAEVWGYLCQDSNRGPRIAERVRPLLGEGDVVMDAYCGPSPLATLLPGVQLFGFDRDPDCIARLRADHPQHTWRAIDERQLPFAPDLPEHVDVLLGLGISHGYAWWDPQETVNNVRYLLGRYAPRACVFETAADYHDAAILRDVKAGLSRLGYDCHYEWFDTDLASYARRKILLARKQSESPT